jgi:hypothetical protein
MSLAKLRKRSLEAYNWTPQKATEAAIKEWNKLLLVSQHVSNLGDGEVAKRKTEEIFQRLAEQFGCVSPNIGDRFPHLVEKYFKPIRDRLVKPPPVNETVHKADEANTIILESDEKLPKVNRKKGSKRKRETHNAIRNLVEYMAKFEAFDYIWQRYVFKEGEGQPKRLFWLAEYQLLNGVPNVRYGPNAKSGKNEKTRYGILHQKLSRNGVQGHGYVLKHSRRRDQNFGPMGKQGYPELKIWTIVVIPPERQLTYQPNVVEPDQ